MPDRGRCGGSWLGFRLRGAVPSLRRARRAAAAVAFAAYTWVLFAVLAVPVLVLLALLPRAQWRRRMARGAVRLLAGLTGTAVTVHGLDRLPDGPSIVVANHPSWLDAVVLATVLPPSFRFVAGEVFEHQVLSGFVLKRLGTEFVERYEREHGVTDTDRLVALVRAGQSLVMFPEGHLARAPGLRPFHMGAFVVAAQAGAPAVPIAIRGTRAMLRPEHRFPRRGAVDIAIGQPIQPIGHRLGSGSRVAARRAGRRPAPLGGTRRRMTRPDRPFPGDIEYARRAAMSSANRRGSSPNHRLA